MRFVSFERGGRKALAAARHDEWRGLAESDDGFPGTLQMLIEAGGTALVTAGKALASAPKVQLDEVTLLPPISSGEKIICVGLNYKDHSSESGFKQPEYPTIFGRFNSSLIAHGAPILRPSFSEQLDYEGELAAIVGKTARDVSETEALDYVAGYSIFNDASIRDYQFKAPQWTPGKNFDDTGAFGPYFVTANELPPGCAGLRLQTRLNGAIVQEASITDMVFSVANLISILSKFLTLKPGDVIVTGTPSGVGLARKPPLWMKEGDKVEVEIEGIGVLSNPVLNRRAAA
jgi:acylpyruvate hydrolase